MHDADINKLIEDNLRLVGYVIYRRFRGYISDADVWQEGRIGLWKAAKNFDPSHGHKFSSYACVTIWRHICRHIKRNTAATANWEFSLDSEACFSGGEGQADPIFGADLLLDESTEAALENICSEAVAEGIIEKIRQKSPRTAEMLALRMNGETYDAIAKQYGLTRERVRQICQKASRFVPPEMKHEYLKNRR